MSIRQVLRSLRVVTRSQSFLLSLGLGVIALSAVAVANTKTLKSIPEPVVKSSITANQGKQVAVFAGGCFWGVEELIRKLPGVLATEVGYTGGHVPNPTYERIVGGVTGHAESVRIEFDPSKVSYADLLRYFFRLHDPTTPNRQGNDRGPEYRSAIFVSNEEQKRIAEEVIREVDASGKWNNKVVTQVVPAATWYPAEEYHQDYLQKNPGGYTCHYLR